MAKVTQNAFGISLKKKKMKITVQCERNTQQTRAGKHSHCLLKISKKKKKKISWLAETRMSPVIVQQTLYKKYRTSAHS